MCGDTSWTWVSQPSLANLTLYAVPRPIRMVQGVVQLWPSERLAIAPLGVESTCKSWLVPRNNVAQPEANRTASRLTKSELFDILVDPPIGGVFQIPPKDKPGCRCGATIC